MGQKLSEASLSVLSDDTKNKWKGSEGQDDFNVKRLEKFICISPLQPQPCQDTAALSEIYNCAPPPSRSSQQPLHSLAFPWASKKQGPTLRQIDFIGVPSSARH